jgi:hypothetical protein
VDRVTFAMTIGVVLWVIGLIWLVCAVVVLIWGLIASSKTSAWLEDQEWLSRQGDERG